MNSEVNSSVNSQQQTPSRLYGLLIFAIIILPMALAYVIFYTGWGIPQGTTNKGYLLQPPQPIQRLPLRNNNGALTTLYSSDSKKWRMLVPVSKNCDRVCTQHLYISRQVHIRLAQKAYRVERILLLLDELSSQEKDNLQNEHPETLLLSTKKFHLNEWLAETGLPDSADQFFYLVDQNGFAMMRYDIEHSGQDLLDDLKKLLKFTYDN